MSRTKRDEDLFKESTMTFGEHLGELRVCLVRALLGIALGFIIGLTVGRAVVTALQTPLRTALEKYLLEESTEKFVERLKKDRPDISDEEVETLKLAFRERGLTSEDVYVDPDDLRPELRRVRPTWFGDSPPEIEPNDGVPARDDMVKIRIWRDAHGQIRIVGLTAYEAFMIYIKASLITGLVLASPWVFYQIWMFVAAGLYSHEKKYVHIYLPFSLLLFLAGASLAFFFVFEPVLEFLFGFYRWLGIEPDQRIGPWLNFVLILPLGFGVSFQLPLVMLFLERIGVMSVTAYIEKWRIAILAIFVISMLLTPADPTSMLLMAIPLSILYVGGVLLCKFLPQKKSPFA